MRYTAKHWTITIRFADSLGLFLLLFIGYLTWSLYQQSGKISVPVHPSMLLSIAVFFVIRGIAVKERKKALEAESVDPNQ